METILILFADRVFQLFEKVLEGTKARIPKDMRAELPYLLWVYSMGVVLFWIHDLSPKHRRTYRLIDHTVDLLDKLIHLASNRFIDHCASRPFDWLRRSGEHCRTEKKTRHILTQSE